MQHWWAEETLFKSILRNLTDLKLKRFLQYIWAYFYFSEATLGETFKITLIINATQLRTACLSLYTSPNICCSPKWTSELLSFPLALSLSLMKHKGLQWLSLRSSYQRIKLALGWLSRAQKSSNPDQPSASRVSLLSLPLYSFRSCALIHIWSVHQFHGCFTASSLSWNSIIGPQ